MSPSSHRQLSLACSFSSSWPSCSPSLGSGPSPRRRRTPKEKARFANSFEIRAVLGSAALLALMLVASKGLAIAFGGGGALALAAVSGLADVDATSLSMTGLAGSRLTPVAASAAILVACAANSLSKSGIAVVIGGRRFGLAYAAASAAAVIATAVVAFVAAW